LKANLSRCSALLLATLACAVAFGRIAFAFAGASLWTALAILAALTLALILGRHIESSPEI
jgi:hypothetical protein